MKKYEREVNALGNAVVRDDGAMIVVTMDGERNEESNGLIADAGDCILLVKKVFAFVLNDCEPLERAFFADKFLEVAIEENRKAMEILEESRRAEQ